MSPRDLPATSRTSLCAQQAERASSNGEMIPNRGAEEARELILVENFFEELKAKVGN